MSVEPKSGKPRVSRRTALTAVAGIGVTVAAASVTHIASAAETTPGKAVPGPIVVRLADLASGRLDVFTGTGYVQVKDKDLAARLLLAAAQA